MTETFEEMLARFPHVDEEKRLSNYIQAAFNLYIITEMAARGQIRRDDMLFGLEEGTSACIKTIADNFNHPMGEVVPAFCALMMRDAEGKRFHVTLIDVIKSPRVGTALGDG